ncbi:MAG: hypothetical protein Q8L68_01660 [Methylococcales bacterium]|nr:hypothetical protein [Methylococcales bacterium]
MPYINQNYCYETLTAAASADVLSGGMVSDTSVVVSLPFTLSSTDTANLNFRRLDFSTATYIDYSVPRVYQSCTQIGPVSNVFGLSIVDVFEVSWLVVICWLAAWSIKPMIRSLQT